MKLFTNNRTATTNNKQQHSKLVSKETIQNNKSTITKVNKIHKQQ